MDSPTRSFKDNKAQLRLVKGTPWGSSIGGGGVVVGESFCLGLGIQS